jgi:predicted nucleic acid-binding protein
MIVIADTSPIHYLVLVGHVDVLQKLYKRVLIPGAVAMELQPPALLQPSRHGSQRLPIG